MTDRLPAACELQEQEARHQRHRLAAPARHGEAAVRLVPGAFTGREPLSAVTHTRYTCVGRAAEM
jgi:hypothetical protein